MRLLTILGTIAFAFALVPAPGGAATAFGTQAVGRPDAQRSVPFIVHLPLRSRAELERLVRLQGTPGTQAYHHWLTPAQFRNAYAPAREQVAAAVHALGAAGVAVDRISSQFIVAHATVGAVERVFGARMAVFRDRGGHVRIGSRVALTLPPVLRRLDAAVDGLVYHGAGHPTSRIAPLHAQPLNRYGLAGPYFFNDFRQAYRYPAYQFASGKGVRVATVNEADFSSADLVWYLQHEKVGGAKGDLAPLPSFSHALVAGALPFDPEDGASVEADLDTQQVAGLAPGATLTGWTTDAFDLPFPYDFLQVYDYINETNSEDVVSTSYGECELYFTRAYNGGYDFTGTLRDLHDAFLQGNAQGITYTVSSGDGAGRPCTALAYFTSDASNRQFSTVPSVSIPSSDPNVVAVGGGNLITSYDPDNLQDLNATYIAENAYADRETPETLDGYGNTLTNLWWGAGGGQSSVWSKPPWQSGITPDKSRSVPDIGLFVGGCFTDDPIFVQPCADDVTHAELRLAGETFQTIGTSVAAPQAAALFASIEQAAGSGTTPGAGRLGNVNPLLYELPSNFYHTSIPGYNGVVSFAGGARWNPSYGLGSLFNSAPFPVAGTPQTPSNP